MNIPPEILALLEAEKFCFLSTSYRDRPHVCLMNFTFLKDEALIILSSRLDTIKVKNILKNPTVALLFHNLGNGEEIPVSCTLYGTASVLPPDQDVPYREIHYQNHQDMGTFIMGSNICIIGVGIQGATLADIKDRVRTWSTADSLNGTPAP